MVDLGYKELLPEIKQLTDLGIVALFITGSYKDMERDIVKPVIAKTANFFEKDIFEKYKELEYYETQSEDPIPDANLFNDLYHREMQNRHFPIQIPVAPVNKPKVGRNDSCPCGSGKKYKKCCMGGVS